MMISWHVANNAPQARQSIHEAMLHRCRMTVEPGDDGWHWSIHTLAGLELTSGRAPSLAAAEEAAEDEFFAIHPVGGHWFEIYCTAANRRPQ